MREPWPTNKNASRGPRNTKYEPWPVRRSLLLGFLLEQLDDPRRAAPFFSEGESVKGSTSFEFKTYPLALPCRAGEWRSRSKWRADTHVADNMKLTNPAKKHAGELVN